MDASEFPAEQTHLVQDPASVEPDRRSIGDSRCHPLPVIEPSLPESDATRPRCRHRADAQEPAADRPKPILVLSAAAAPKTASTQPWRKWWSRYREQSRAALIRRTARRR